MKPGNHAVEGSYRRDATIKIGRAVAIIVIAAAAGVFLLHKSPGKGGSLDLALSTTKQKSHHVATTTTVPKGTKKGHHRTGGTTTPANGGTVTTTVPATTTTLVPVSKLVVVPVNGTETYHAAAFFEAILAKDGYPAQTPNDATSTSIATSVIYYQPGFQPEAAALAQSLQLPATAVQAYSTAAPLPATLGTPATNIVLLIGADLAKQVTAT